jgi:hypothetical protein
MADVFTIAVGWSGSRVEYDAQQSNQWREEQQKRLAPGNSEIEIDDRTLLSTPIVACMCSDWSSIIIQWIFI